MTIYGDPTKVQKIKVKSFCIDHRLIKIVGIRKNEALELNQLKEIYEHCKIKVDHPKLNVVYVCKIGNIYERCILLEIDDILTKSLTVLLLDCKKELHISPEQVSYSTYHRQHH